MSFHPCSSASYDPFTRKCLTYMSGFVQTSNGFTVDHNTLNSTTAGINGQLVPIYSSDGLNSWYGVIIPPKSFFDLKIKLAGYVNTSEALPAPSLNMLINMFSAPVHLDSASGHYKWTVPETNQTTINHGYSIPAALGSLGYAAWNVNYTSLPILIRNLGDVALGVCFNYAFNKAMTTASSWLFGSSTLTSQITMKLVRSFLMDTVNTLIPTTLQALQTRKINVELHGLGPFEFDLGSDSDSGFKVV